MNVPRLLSALVLLAAAAGAQAQGLSMPKQAKPAASASPSAMPLVDAEVRKLDAQKGYIVLKHGELANLGLPPMTMGFDVADIKAGD